MIEKVYDPQNLAESFFERQKKIEAIRKRHIEENQAIPIAEDVHSVYLRSDRQEEELKNADWTEVRRIK